jgi:hypothetical protein
MSKGRRLVLSMEAKEAKNQKSLVGDRFIGKFGFLPPLPPYAPLIRQEGLCFHQFFRGLG